MSDFVYICDECKSTTATLGDCVRCSAELCMDCFNKNAGLCGGCAEELSAMPVTPAEPLPFTPTPITHLQATLDEQLEILGELFHTAVKPGCTMRRKTQAVDQFDIALRFVRMLVKEQ